MLTALSVTTSSDSVSHVGESLRDAIATANADALTGESDTITFAPSLSGSTITLAQGQLELGQGGVGSGLITIDGANQITIDGGSLSRVMFVDGNVQAILTGLTISGGAADTGGAIYSGGFLTVSNSTISDNEGGGIYNYGELTISDSTLSGNSSSTSIYETGYGGGVYNDGRLTLVDSTISGNTVGQQGAGIFNDGVVVASNSTISANNAGNGIGGIDNHGMYCSATLLNTIVADNGGLSSPDISGPVGSFSGSDSLIGDGDGQTDVVNGVNGNQVGSSASPIDPLLAPLANNGGVTQTMALLAGSPAIDAGGALTTGVASANGSSLSLGLAPAIARSPGDFVVQVDGEQMLVSDVDLSSNSFTVLTRGYNGTAIVAHAGGPVILPYDQIGQSRLGSVDIGAFEYHPAVKIVAPTTQSTLENAALVFSSANGNAISIDDASAGAGRVQLTLAATNGTLTLAPVSGLQYTAGGNGAPTSTVQGTLTSINAALSGLTFTPNTSYVGPANLTLNFSDLGIGGAGPAQTSSQTVPITVKYPTYTVVNNQSGYSEPAGTWTASSVLGYNGVAAETSSSASAVATWTPTVKNGDYQLWFYNPATAGASTDALISVVHNGQTSNFYVNEASGTAGFVLLQTIFFTGSGNESISISQGPNSGTLYASAIQLVGQGYATPITAPATQSVLENGALVFSAANSNALSIAAPSVTTNTVQLAIAASNGALTLATTSGLTFIAGANNSIAFTVQGTLASINAALNGLTFTPTTNYVGAANLTLNFSDLGIGGAGPAQTSSASVAITVKYPIYTVVNNQSGYSEPAGTWTASSVLGYNGVATETSSSANAVATWTPTAKSGDYQLWFYNPATPGASTDALITVVHNGQTSSFYVNEASGTAGFVLLQSIFFAGTGNESISISQGPNSGTLYASAVQLVGQGYATPINAPATQSVLENGSLVFSAANSNALSVIAPSVTTNTVQLAVAVSNGRLTLPTTSGLTFTAGTNNSTAFTVQGALASINAALNGLTFTPSTSYVGPANLTLNFSDLGIGGAGPAQTSSQTVPITVKYPVYTVVNNQSGYSEPAGTWTASSVLGYNGVAAETSSSANAVATWTPMVKNGDYQLWFYDPATAGASTDALISVVHNGQTSNFYVNEASGTAGFVLLQTIFFTGSGNESISISQGPNSGTLYASAIQLVGQGYATPITAPATQSVLENGALVFSAANSNALSIAAPSVTTNTVQLAIAASNGALTLATTSGLTFIAGANNSIAFTVQGTLASINAALNGLTFTPTTSYVGAANLTLNFSDLGIGGAGPAQTSSKAVAISVAGIVNFNDLALAADSDFNGPTANSTPTTDAYGDPGFSGTFTSGGVRFSNQNYGAAGWSGFAVSNTSDTTTGDYTNQYSAYPGVSANGPGQNYGIASGYLDQTANLSQGFDFDPTNVSELEQLPNIQLPTGASIKSIEVANTTYAALTMLDGSQFSSPFTAGSYFDLDVYGTNAAGQALPNSVEFTLASGTNILSTWATVDLSSLSDATTLYFNLVSSDQGAYGMNTPAYFAIDNIQYATP